MGSQKKIRCILFDRDGTLGELSDVRYPETFVPFCSVAEVFRTLRERGYKVGIITNQSSIARGTGAGYDFEGEFASFGADVWEICPHDVGDNCDCRKPKSGLLLRAAAKLGIPPEECAVVGDRISDLECAFRVGATGILVRTGKGYAEEALARETYPGLTVLDRFDGVPDLFRSFAPQSS